MSTERCNNQNHSKMNVLVRYCATCGEIVNRKIKTQHCSQESHAQKRKSGSQHCVNCGKNLRV